MHLYGMRLRGFSPMCQPRGVVKVFDGGKKYWDVLAYDRKLTEKEIRDYELDEIPEKEYIKYVDK